MRIAVIGSGISGNGAAWALSQTTDAAGYPLHDVTMYERRDRSGGHSHTIDIDYEGRKIPVDVGFIVYNELNYPNLVALFDHIGVETIKSDMSFGVSLNNGKLEWSGHSLNTIFAQRRNLFSPSFLKMLRDILRFNKKAADDLKQNALGDVSLGDYLHEHKFSRSFRDRYLAPMGAAIWSTPHADIFDFPARSFIQFFDNHRLMHRNRDRPAWRTVKGGSRNYVSKITAPFQDKIRFNAEVVEVKRVNGLVSVKDVNGHIDHFDHVVFAAHTDQTLKMMGDANDLERSILGAITYRPNEVYLHKDERLMPSRKKVWSSWNYIETPIDLQKQTGVCVSYSMNQLQKIDPTKPVFVSLNPATPPRDDKIFAKTNFSHPQFDKAAIEAQSRLHEIQGKGNIWYCGAWCGYGFHEDGLKSGLDVAEKLGARIPWRNFDESVQPHLEAAE